MKIKISILVFVILLIIFILPVNAYQTTPIGNGNPRATQNDWRYYIRNLEQEGYGMGLRELLSNLSATNGSNNIDIHLQKGTEYGATLILGISDYGKQGTGTDRYISNGSKTTTGTDVKASSTGNVTGVFELGTMATPEWTSEFNSASYNNIITNVYNSYPKKYFSKNGTDDSMTYLWQGASYISSFFTNSDKRGVVRGGTNGAFAYSTEWEISSYSVKEGTQNKWYYPQALGRACVVCGEGF